MSSFDAKTTKPLPGGSRGGVSLYPGANPGRSSADRITTLHSRLTLVHGITPLAERSRSGARGVSHQFGSQSEGTGSPRNRGAGSVQSRGRTVAASHVDHITPHLGQWLLFFKYENTQSLCARHHNMHKQQEKLYGARAPVAISLSDGPRPIALLVVFAMVRRSPFWVAYRLGRT